MKACSKSVYTISEEKTSSLGNKTKKVGKGELWGRMYKEYYREYN